MGKFPDIQYSETIPSGNGPAVTGNLDVSTGAGAIAQGMEALGGFFENLQKAQDASDLSIAERKIHDNWNAEYNALADIQDPETRRQLHTKSTTDRASIVSAIKRKSVRELAQRNLNSYEPQFDMHFNHLDRTMRIGVMGDELDKDIASGVASLDYARVEKAVGLAVHTGVITEPKGEFLLMQAKEKIDYDKTFSLAIRTGDKETGYKVIDGSSLSDEDKDKLGNKLDNYWSGRAKKEKDEKYAATLKSYDDFTKKITAGNLAFDDVEKSNLVKTDKDKWQGYIQGSFKDVLLTATPEGYQSIKDTVLNFSQGQISKQQAYDNILAARYNAKGATISDADFKWALDKLEHPYPKHLVPDIESTLAANRTAIQHEGVWYWETAGDIERSKEINMALLGWIDNELANKKTPTAKEMFQRSAELMAGQKTIEQAKPVKNPYPEYPDAFYEEGEWRIIKDGKKYRIKP